MLTFKRDSKTYKVLGIESIIYDTIIILYYLNEYGTLSLTTIFDYELGGLIK